MTAHDGVERAAVASSAASASVPPARPVPAGLALPAVDGRLWRGGKRAGWNRAHDLATGAALRPGYRAAGAVSGINAGTATASVCLRPGIRGRRGALTVAPVATDHP